MQRFVGVLPTETLIKRAVERPIGWIAPEGREELYKRINSGALDRAQEEHLAEVLQRMIPGAEYPEINRLGHMLAELAVAPATPTTSGTVKADIAGFLCEQWYEEEHIWLEIWTFALIDLHKGGFVPAEDWDALRLDAATPRVWSSAKGPLRPGEEFFVGCRFRSRGLLLRPDLRGIYLDLPEGFEIEETLSRGFYGTGNASGFIPAGLPLMPTVRVKAGTVPGEHPITVRLLYSLGTPSRDKFDEWIEQGGPEPGVGVGVGVVVIERTIPVVVAAPSPEATSPGATDPAKRLQAGVLPAFWTGAQMGGYGRVWFGLSVPVRGWFWCAGSLVAIEADGTREILGRFEVSSSGSHWNSREGSSSGSGNPWGALGDESTIIHVRVRDKYAHPASTARLVLVFESLRWADGTEYEGPLPVEIEVPLDRLSTQPKW